MWETYKDCREHGLSHGEICLSMDVWSITAGKLIKAYRRYQDTGQDPEFDSDR